MDNTLRAAMGTWPSENAYPAEAQSQESTPSGLNERFDFGTASSPSAAEVFHIESEPVSSKNVFVPPSVIPPKDMSNGDSARPQPGSARNGDLPLAEEDAEQMDIEPPPRSPSPALDPALKAEKARFWSPEARRNFHAMVTDPNYVNRYRMHMKKRQRMTHYLEHPDLEPHLCDGSKDHQTKYQATNWTLVDGQLYRKPEAGRVGKLRRHVDEMDAWEVITTEHLRSGHAGRDKLRKRLEGRYIGYTLQEIMFVLRECRRCGGGPEKGVEMTDAEAVPDEQEMEVLDEETLKPTGPYVRKQTSNAMWF